MLTQFVCPKTKAILKSKKLLKSIIYKNTNSFTKKIFLIITKNVIIN